MARPSVNLLAGATLIYLSILLYNLPPLADNPINAVYVLLDSLIYGAILGYGHAYSTYA